MSIKQLRTKKLQRFLLQKVAGCFCVIHLVLSTRVVNFYDRKCLARITFTNKYAARFSPAWHLRHYLITRNHMSLCSTVSTERHPQACVTRMHCAKMASLMLC